LLKYRRVVRTSPEEVWNNNSKPKQYVDELWVCLFWRRFPFVLSILMTLLSKFWFLLIILWT